MSGSYEVPARVGMTKLPFREHVMAVSTITLVNALDRGSISFVELAGDGTSKSAAN